MNKSDSYFDRYINNSKSSFPSNKSEEYRYSSVITRISELDLHAEKKEGRGKVTLPWESDWEFHADYSIDDSREGLGIKKFDTLSPIFHRHQNYFKQVNLVENDQFYHIECSQEKIVLSFTASERTVCTENIYLCIPERKKVQIEIHFYTEKNSLAIPLIFVEAGKESFVEIIYIVDQEYNKGIVSPLFEIVTYEKSHASLQTFVSDIPNQRLSFIGYCAGAESHIDLRTGFYLQKDEACDLFVRIYHEAPNSTSNQIIKTAVLDSSTMNFNGQIYANGSAQNIYAYQMLKGMILADEAQIFARPQLDIEYYELACSHGVSIGGFDPESLFYLKSRGISEQDVYPLLLYGFFTEPFIDLPLESYWSSQIKMLLGIKSI